MRIELLALRDFTAFAQTDIEFSPGLNVLIGENGTGKSHVLKVLYGMLAPFSLARGNGPPARSERAALGHKMLSKLVSVFRPEGGLARLIRHGGKEMRVRVTCDFGTTEVALTNEDAPKARVPPPPKPPVPRLVFVPAGEVLSIYPGFIAAYEHRELAFDETVYDLCLALSAAPLRRIEPPGLRAIVERLEKAVGGRTRLKGQTFYVEQGKDRLLESQLLAEGLRKLASIAQLVRNGALTEGAVLFWDEPEANINPRLVPTVARALLALAGAGVQVFIATHDFLLSNELSLPAEYETSEAKKAAPKFFSLSKANPTGPVEVEWGATLADLRHNPILEEFAAHYDREHRLFAGETEQG